MSWTDRLAERATVELMRSTIEKRPRGTWAALRETPYETIKIRLRRLRAAIDTTGDVRGMWTNDDVRWLIEMAEARVRSEKKRSSASATPLTTEDK